MTLLSIIFLGTGGSWPTVKRNVSSVALKRAGEIILFDCGEGTQRQFQKSSLSYMQISKIFITHFHGDHFLGLPGLIQTMQLNEREKPLPPKLKLIEIPQPMVRLYECQHCGMRFMYGIEGYRITEEQKSHLRNPALIGGAKAF